MPDSPHSIELEFEFVGYWDILAGTVLEMV